MASYENLLNAVQMYYNDADYWIEIAQRNLTPNEFAQFASEVPGLKIIRNGNGEIIDYWYRYANTPELKTAIGSVPNSNALVARYGEGSVIRTNIPAETAISETGRVTARSGLATAGHFVSAEVLPAVAAAGLGISLGKTIDSLLYNAAPDFWDENGMSSLNPETWSTITAGDDSFQSRLFNMVFGIDENTSATQPYLDAEAAAYLALYMQRQGMFNTMSHNPGKIEYDGYVSGFQGSINGPYYISTYNNNTELLKNAVCVNPLIKSNSGDWGWGNPIGIRYNSVDYPCVTSYGICRYYNANNRNFLCLVVITEEVYNAARSSRQIILSNGEIHGWSGGYTPIKITITEGGVQHIYYALPYEDALLSPTNKVFVDNNISCDSNIDYAYLIRAALMGTTVMPLDGVGTQQISDGQGGTIAAKTPQLTDDMSIEDVSQALQEQYPELFNHSVTKHVVQPDGTIKDIVYIPIGWPDATSVTDTQPTISDQTQEDTRVKPETAPESRLSDITTTIVDTTVLPPPDTGDGDTPPYVPPIGSATALWSIYNPTETEVKAFGAWLWSPDFVDQLLKMFNDPMQSIISLHKVFGPPATGVSQNIKVGYLTSTATALTVTSQYTTVNCGSVDMHEYFGNVLDYSPFTSVRLYLPFIGIVDIDDADVMRSTVTITYKIDVLTGACLAEVFIQRDNAGGVLYTYNGNASVEYPLSSGNYMGVVAGISSAVGFIAVGSPIGAVHSVASARSRVSHSGQLTGNPGAMGIKKPYFIIQRPQRAMSSDYNVYDGNPSNYSVLIGDCAGFIRVKSCHVDGIAATGKEKEEIKQLLKEGIIV